VQTGLVNKTTLHPFSRRRRLNPRLRTGVCLHGHTLHSREPLTFLHPILRRHPLLNWAVRNEEQKRLGKGKPRIDFSKIWWTPPLCPRQAWDVEAAQISRVLGLQPLISLTDHDTAEASWALRIVQPDVPISMEWTVHTGRTFLHLGVHNLPFERASELVQAMQAHAAGKGAPRAVPELLAGLDAHPGVLTVLNHPFWDESGIGRQEHQRHLLAFLNDHRRWIHALELNGFRPAAEEEQVLRLAGELRLPVVAGGDRHGRTAASVLNVTTAETFEEFVEEVRRDGFSDIVLLPHYFENRTLRIMQTIGEIVREAPDHAMGWRRWCDRIFYEDGDGAVRPAAWAWNGSCAPWLPEAFVAAMSLADTALRTGAARSWQRGGLIEGEEAPL